MIRTKKPARAKVCGITKICILNKKMRFKFHTRIMSTKNDAKYYLNFTLHFLKQLQNKDVSVKLDAENQNVYCTLILGCTHLDLLY